MMRSASSRTPCGWTRSLRWPTSTCRSITALLEASAMPTMCRSRWRRDMAGLVRTLEAIVAEFPRDTQSRARLGVLLHLVGQNDRAVKLLRDGLALDPKDEDLLN